MNYYIIIISSIGIQSSDFKIMEDWPKSFFFYVYILFAGSSIESNKKQPGAATSSPLDYTAQTALQLHNNLCVASAETMMQNASALVKSGDS